MPPCRHRRLVVFSLMVLGSTYPGAQAIAGGKVPVFDIKKSCADAREFSKDFQDNNDYRSCLADETRARKQLGKTWSSFKPSQRRQCLEPGPDPSYVETLTCLQMDKSDGPGSDVGGRVAPGLDFK